MLNYLLKYTYRIDGYKLDDTVKKAQWWFKKWGVDLYIDTKRTHFSELDEDNYEVRASDGTQSLAKKKIAELMELEDSENNLYDGIIMFANKDDALEKATLRGQQTRATMTFGSVRHTFGVLEVYSQDPRFVRLRKDRREGVYKYTGTTKERGSAFRQDVYVLIHEILHDMADIIGIQDYLHINIERNEFEEYARRICKMYVTYYKAKKDAETNLVGENTTWGSKYQPDSTDLAVARHSEPIVIKANPLLIENPDIEYIVIHHTASSRASGNDQYNAVEKFQREKNWGTPQNPFYQPRPSSLGSWITYNDFIDVSGKLTATRAVGEETIAVVGHNCDIRQRCDAIHVCVAGNFNQELLNDKQIETLREYLKARQEEYPNAQIVFHKDLQANRTCAGKLFTREYLETRILQENIEESDPEEKLDAEELEKIMKQLNLLSKFLPFIPPQVTLKILEFIRLTLLGR